MDIPDEILKKPDNAKYVGGLIEGNGIKPSHIPEPQCTRKPNVAADIEKIASTIAIKNINWNEVRNHKVGHLKNNNEARKEILAKGNACTDARILHTIYYTITEVWSATKVVSKLMWVKCDRETVNLLMQIKASS